MIIIKLERFKTYELIILIDKIGIDRRSDSIMPRPSDKSSSRRPPPLLGIKSGARSRSGIMARMMPLDRVRMMSMMMTMIIATTTTAAAMRRSRSAVRSSTTSRRARHIKRHWSGRFRPLNTAHLTSRRAHSRFNTKARICRSTFLCRARFLFVLTHRLLLRCSSTWRRCACLGRDHAIAHIVSSRCCCLDHSWCQHDRVRVLLLLVLHVDRRLDELHPLVFGRVACRVDHHLFHDLLKCLAVDVRVEAHV